jgi:hypothetical protein
MMTQEEFDTRFAGVRTTPDGKYDVIGAISKVRGALENMEAEFGKIISNSTHADGFWDLFKFPDSLGRMCGHFFAVVGHTHASVGHLRNTKTSKLIPVRLKTVFTVDNICEREEQVHQQYAS